MKTLTLKKGILGFLFVSLSTGFALAQSMSFSVITKTCGGSYKPKHVLACWITNSTNFTTTASFIRTINFQSSNGDNSTSYLTSWVKNSAKNTVNAITGATLSVHNQATNGSGISRIPFTWNFKNSRGTVVTDGTYYLNIEFSEGTRQIIQYPITKGTTSYTIVPTPVTANAYFASPSLTYTAPTAALTPTEVVHFDYVYNRTDRSLQLAYDAANHSGIVLQLVNLKGQTIHQAELKGSWKETTQLPNCSPGLYLIRLTDKNGWNQTKKLML